LKTALSLSIATLLAAALLAPRTASAHGFAGERFFPATLATDDPFVADELSLPTITTIITPDDGGTRDTEVSFDLARRITDRWGIEVGQDYLKLSPYGEKTVHGFGNLELGTKYEVIKSEAHEAIVSLGLDVELGGTGRKLVGADSFTTWTPAIFFGKGLGDLPASLSVLRPIAVTGLVGLEIPGSASTRTISDGEIDLERHANTLQYGFALEYSLIYLQEHVKDVGLKAPFDRMIPLVEFAFETPLDRGQSGQTTGTINPGIIWSGQYCQIGAEAMIPINSRTGSNVGVLVQLHFYLDDLLPKIFGKPLFGGNK
jgi:hypothetical protein